MKLVRTAMLAGGSLLALSNTSWGQASGEGDSQARDVTLEEIIVTARRKDERLQDVPSTVNVVTAETIENLNIRNFDELDNIIPGLIIGGAGTTTTASVRGITFNQVTSGNNGTIEFYLNDSPLPATNLFQVMYDIGQIELLRGPQGTLRGRAAPSGSMTVTTRRPDMAEFGGYLSVTGTDQSGINGNGAINIPILDDKLAVRLAALWDENEGSTVESVNHPDSPLDRSKSGRATVQFEPTDNLSFVLTYQKLERESRSFSQVESLQATNPAAPASPVMVAAGDRRAVQDIPSRSNLDLEITNLQAQWSFLGQRLNYVGSVDESSVRGEAATDFGDFFGPTSPAYLQGYTQTANTDVEVEGHELRLSSEERLFGLLDYTVGAFYESLDSPTNLVNRTPTLFAAPNPGNLGVISNVPVLRTNSTKEESAFANLTLHLFDALEIAAGLRYIEYTAEAGVVQNGVPIAAFAQHDDFDTTIYSGSVKYAFSDNAMAYALVGTSWRPGVTVIGDFSVAPSPRELMFTHLAPEESTSYEIGTKLSFLDQRMQLNLAAFHQTFDNSPYRALAGVVFVETLAVGPPPIERVRPFNFAAAVPIEVDGVEAEWSYRATEDWDMNVAASYAKSKIDSGLIPCNDYFPIDGIPDSTAATPTTALQIRTATGGENLAACTVDYRATTAPLWSGSIQSEYRFPISSSIDSYLRGQMSLYGPSQNDPTNPIDDIDDYGLLNLYLGVRSSTGAWEVSLYGKNITETERVLSRPTAQLTTSYAQQRPAPLPPAQLVGVTNYRSISFTPPREFGVSLRYSFGSR